MSSKRGVDGLSADPRVHLAGTTPVTEDEARIARTDKLIAEMEATIADARTVSAKMAAFFREMGIEDDALLRDSLRKERCSPDLWAMLEEDRTQLEEELKKAEGALLAETRQGRRRTRRPRRMTRI